MTGWTITTEKTELPKPVETDDDEVTDAVSKISWTATDGGLTPGQFDLFTVSAGPLPTNNKTLVLNVLQPGSGADPDEGDGQPLSASAPRESPVLTV